PLPRLQHSPHGLLRPVQFGLRPAPGGESQKNDNSRATSLHVRTHSQSSFPGSVWERTVFAALPRGFFAGHTPVRQSLAGPAFPGRAWERGNTRPLRTHTYLAISPPFGDSMAQKSSSLVVSVTVRTLPSANTASIPPAVMLCDLKALSVSGL